MTVNRMFLRGIVVGFFLCLTGSLAFGQDNRTWVSAAAGVTDPGACAASNICTRTAPCATFQCALAATNPGGEIDVLDSGDYRPVTIGKSVSIVAEGVVAGIQPTSSGDAITVNVGSSDVVVLRGLTLEGVGPGFDGINFIGGGTLHVENCAINHFSSRGILVFPHADAHIFIKDTILRNNLFGIVFGFSSSVTITASLDNVRAENNSNTGILAQTQANVTVSVRNSVVAGNGTGVIVSQSPTSQVINLESSIVSGNSFDGLQSDGANSTINITNVTVVNNGTGLAETNGGHIVSFGNNKITDNTTNGSPTKTIAQH
jgi:hypothetical protein